MGKGVLSGMTTASGERYKIYEMWEHHWSVLHWNGSFWQQVGKTYYYRKSAVNFMLKRG